MVNDLGWLLKSLRARRRFDVELYLEAKTLLLHDYFLKSGLKACVLGVSGGVDSAVTLGLLQRVARRPNSPLEKIVCALMPMHLSAGASGQAEATARGRATVEAMGGDFALIDLSSSHQEMKGVVDQALRIAGEAWAAGQLVSNLRSPALYYASSLLTQSGLPAIVVGTTNRDEGGYIGYFGKAADGLNDLQAISDLHKSEVYQLARALGVPRSVIDAKPTGDIYDGRDDETLIGASYDAIELYGLFRCLEDSAEAASLESELSENARAEFLKVKKTLDTLNRQCAHKYLGGSVSVHLDVYPRAVPGGWRTELNPEDLAAYRSRAGGFVAEFKLEMPLSKGAELSVSEAVANFGECAGAVRGLLTVAECASLRARLQEPAWQTVGVHGRAGLRAVAEAAGSDRATAYDEDFARELWRRLAPTLPPVRVINKNGLTDVGDDAVWRPVGVSPALRFIRYRDEGSLVPHYDSPFEYWEARRTLMSLIIYLTDAEEAGGGCTRFVRDPQRGEAFAERNFADWDRPADSSEIIYAMRPEAGAALFFDHRILHDAEPLTTSGEKIVLRTDIIFERGGSRRRAPTSPSKALGFPDTDGDAEADADRAIDAHTLAKVNEDPHYREVWRRFGSRRRLHEAGFFDDLLPIGESYLGAADTRWFATPVDKILRNLARPAEGWPAVLLTTGGFAPVHQCHIEMLEQAKTQLEGARVLGGYLSPSHDKYVLNKAPGEILGAHHRAHLCEQAVIESDWLMVDTWEALHCKEAMNFTTVVDRLQGYLAAHVKTEQPIRVIYVFGSDNAGFSYAFSERGESVCVMRPGWEDKFRAVSEDSLIATCPRVRMIATPTADRDVSSRKVRGGEASFLVERVRTLFETWKLNQIEEPRVPATYFFRNEQKQAVSNWRGIGANEGEGTYAPELGLFRERLLEVFREVFRAASGPGARFDVDFKIVTLSDQMDAAGRLSRGHRVISMDPLIPGDFALAISRRFSLASGAGKSAVVARPGHPSLQEQVAAIPADAYILLDDDIATGATMRQAMSHLPPSIRITDQVGLIRLSEKLADDRFPLDVLDFRDFICGAREGGLVVQLPNGQDVRAPYMLPYVSPAERASTPLCQNLEFSRAVWKLNREFFASLASDGAVIRLGDVDASFRELMKYVGFAEDETMEEICAWHESRIQIL